jgi:cytochrome c oxidase subunit II
VGRQKLENIGRSPDLPGCVLLCASGHPDRGPSTPPLSPRNIFAPASTPAQSIFGLSIFVLAVTGAIFIIVFALLAYSVVKFRKRKNDDGREPPQVYGSNQVEVLSPFSSLWRFSWQQRA